MPSRDERAQIGGGVGRIADDDARHEVRDAVDEFVVERGGDDRPGRRGAVLSAVDDRGRDRTVDRCLQVGVVEDDERRLAAEFELDPCPGGGGLRHHLPADRARPGEGHHVDAGMSGQVCAGIRTGADDDVENAVGQSGLGGDAGHRQRRQRRDLGRLQDHRATGGECRDDLPHRHLQRVVPGRDGADDADGFTADRRGVVARVLRTRLALEIACDTGEELDVVDRSGDVELGREPDRLAGVRDLFGDQHLGLRRQRSGQREQDTRPFGRGGTSPGRLRGAGTRDRGIDIAATCEFHSRNRLIRGRIDHDAIGTGRVMWLTVDPAGRDAGW